MLGIPQPTLSRSIARLSAAVGSPLFERSGRGIRLTRHGRLLAAHAERALTEIVEGIRTIHTEPDPDGTGPKTAPVWTYKYLRTGETRETVYPTGAKTLATYNKLGQQITERVHGAIPGTGPGPAMRTRPLLVRQFNW